MGLILIWWMGPMMKCFFSKKTSHKKLLHLFRPGGIQVKQKTFRLLVAHFPSFWVSFQLQKTGGTGGTGPLKPETALRNARFAEIPNGGAPGGENRGDRKSQEIWGLGERWSVESFPERKKINIYIYTHTGYIWCNYVYHIQMSRSSGLKTTKSRTSDSDTLQ